MKGESNYLLRNPGSPLKLMSLTPPSLNREQMMMDGGMEARLVMNEWWKRLLDDEKGRGGEEDFSKFVAAASEFRSRVFRIAKLRVFWWGRMGFIELGIEINGVDELFAWESTEEKGYTREGFWKKKKKKKFGLGSVRLRFTFGLWEEEILV